MSEEDEKRRESAGKTIMIGIGFAVVGLLLSAASYGGASSGLWTLLRVLRIGHLGHLGCAQRFV